VRRTAVGTRAVGAAALRLAGDGGAARSDRSARARHGAGLRHDGGGRRRRAVRPGRVRGQSGPDELGLFGRDGRRRRRRLYRPQGRCEAAEAVLAVEEERERAAHGVPEAVRHGLRVRGTGTQRAGHGAAGSGRGRAAAVGHAGRHGRVPG